MKNKLSGDFLEAAKARYLNEIGEKDERLSRKRHLVEMRGALMNAAYAYVPRVECGSIWGKDHSTAIHASNQHEVYMKYSPNYREKYLEAEMALEWASEIFSFSPRNNNDVALEKIDNSIGIYRRVLKILERKREKMNNESLKEST